jgi:hypothetical protein
VSRIPYVLSGLALIAGLAGCSSSGAELPDESDFAAGTCRTAAPDIRAIGQSLPELGGDATVDREVRAELREAHDRLRALGDGLVPADEPELRPALAELNEKIAIVRIRADGNSYEPALGKLLTRSYEAVLDVCTGSGTAG